jgi:hypothetical protein
MLMRHAAPDLRSLQLLRQHFRRGHSVSGVDSGNLEGQGEADLAADDWTGASCIPAERRNEP